MRAPVAAPDGQSKRDGNDRAATVVAFQPRRGLVQQLRAVGLHVELKRIGRFVVPVVSIRAGERPQ